MEMQEFIESMKTRPRKADWLTWFDNLIMPHWTNYLTPYDVEQLRYIATSKKLAGNMRKKQDMIKAIMKARGFARFAGGTNRLVFKFYEDPNILAKVAIDTVGMQDNPLEYNTQHAIKPFCSKMLQITPCGTVGFSERLMPITSAAEFQMYADMVYDFITTKLIGKFVVDDIGTKFFMNYAVRPNFGPCLVDYPYIYELDGAKLMCMNQFNGMYCGGEIDYDSGFNHLHCTKCGKKYNATDLRKQAMENRFVITKGGFKPMAAKIMRGGKVIASSNTADFAVDPANRVKEYYEPSGTKAQVIIRRGNKILAAMDTSADKAGTMVKKDTQITEQNIFPEEPETVQETPEVKAEPQPALGADMLDLIRQQYEDYKAKVEEETQEPAPEEESQVPEVEEEDVSQVTGYKEEDESQETKEKRDPFLKNKNYSESRDTKGRKVIGTSSHFIPDEKLMEDY